MSNLTRAREINKDINESMKNFNVIEQESNKEMKATTILSKQ